MRSLIKKTFTSLLLRVPDAFFEAPLHVRSGRITPVLLYHTVGESEANPLVGKHIHTVSLETFSEHLRVLKKFFTIVSLAEILDRLQNGKTVRGLAAITFDDGYRSVFAKALPILQSLDMPFTAFLVSRIVQKQAFWRDKIRWVLHNNLTEPFIAYGKKIHPSFASIRQDRFYQDTKNPVLMNSKLVDQALDSFIADTKQQDAVRAAGELVYCREEDIKRADSPLVSFGNHTANHYVLSSLSEEEQYREIHDGHTFLERLGKTPNPFFSVPFGGQTDFNKATLNIIRDAGYAGYLLSEYRINVFPRGAHASRFLQGVSLNRFMPPDDAKRFYFQLLRY